MKCSPTKRDAAKARLEAEQKGKKGKKGKKAGIDDQ